MNEPPTQPEPSKTPLTDKAEFPMPGARLVSERYTTATFARSLELALKLVKLWLETPFSNDPRHVRRIQAIES